MYWISYSTGQIQEKVIQRFQRQKERSAQFGVRLSLFLCMSFSSPMVESSGCLSARRFVFCYNLSSHPYRWEHMYLILGLCSTFVCSKSLIDHFKTCLQSFLIVSDPAITKHILRENSKAYSKVLSGLPSLFFSSDFFRRLVSVPVICVLG